MRKFALLLAVLALGQCTMTATALQSKHKTHKKTKNEISKIRKARKDDHTVRQVTPDPKKSPGKHADNLSKNVNHETNRVSKDINHAFQNKDKKKDKDKGK